MRCAKTDKVRKTIFFLNAFGADSDPFSVFQNQIFCVLRTTLEEFHGHVAPRLCAT